MSYEFVLRLLPCRHQITWYCFRQSLPRAESTYEMDVIEIVVSNILQSNYTKSRKYNSPLNSKGLSINVRPFKTSLLCIGSSVCVSDPPIMSEGSNLVISEGAIPVMVSVFDMT